MPKYGDRLIGHIYLRIGTSRKGNNMTDSFVNCQLRKRNKKITWASCTARQDICKPRRKKFIHGGAIAISAVHFGNYWLRCAFNFDLKFDF